MDCTGAPVQGSVPIVPIHYSVYVCVYIPYMCIYMYISIPYKCWEMGQAEQGRNFPFMATALLPAGLIPHPRWLGGTVTPTEVAWGE